MKQLEDQSRTCALGFAPAQASLALAQAQSITTAFTYAPGLDVESFRILLWSRDSQPSTAKQGPLWHVMAQKEASHALLQTWHLRVPLALFKNLKLYPELSN